MGKKKRRSISLFSGILGLDIGLHGAGFEAGLAMDIDKDASEVSSLNFPNLVYLQEDINNFSRATIEGRGVDAEGIDLLAGGPPCQPFSKAGLRKGLDDTRGNLFRQYVRILHELKPRAFILENVRGLVSSNGGQDYREVMDCFRASGYTVYASLLDAASYGVPQFRQRLFIVGFKDRIRFEFPIETHSPGSYVTAKMALEGLQDPGRYPTYRGKYAELLNDIPPGLNYSYYCAERGHPEPLFEWRSKFWYFLYKADPNAPVLTIQAYPGNNTGPFHWENRRFGVNELKRFQTFPDDFSFGSLGYGACHRLLGNAVPPLLALRIGEKIADALDKEEKISELEYLGIRKRLDSTKLKSGNGSGKGRKEGPLAAPSSKETIIKNTQRLLDRYVEESP